jgi:DNA-binding response OmpR family regulator
MNEPTKNRDFRGGVAVCRRRSYKIGALDIDLPDLDETVAATTPRARPYMNDVPILAVAAQDGASTRRLIVACGCDGHMPKPIDIRQFRDPIAAYLIV